jgi:hypothetical protein
MWYRRKRMRRPELNRRFDVRIEIQYPLAWLNVDEANIGLAGALAFPDLRWGEIFTERNNGLVPVASPSSVLARLASRHRVPRPSFLRRVPRGSAATAVLAATEIAGVARGVRWTGSGQGTGCLMWLIVVAG